MKQTKGVQTALYPGNEDKVGYWLTPPDVMERSESKKGKTVVVVLPIPAWIELLMEAGAEFRYMGRIRWCRPDGTQTKRPRYPSAIFILRGKVESEKEAKS